MRIVLILAILIGCQPLLFAQKTISGFQYTVDSTVSKNHFAINYKDWKNSDANSSGRYIVKFRQSTNARSTDPHTQFETDLQNLSSKSSARTGLNQTSQTDSKIHFHYQNTFNGAAFSADSETITALKELGYISYITEDKKIKVSDDQSNNVIKANQVWSNYGATGKNIRIGIIDTGIDYNHPDLGGGIGSSFKVIGGYDFVNNDNDPMDDYGHGTHVAGISAANGSTLKGVAPDAKLVAYKVLGADGYGYNSWIIAAIERSIDPDQNPATDDHLDVVNMSLGGQASEDDPLSEAVNNAVAQGVIFVVAAGNSYSNETIGSPGVAENAITVGASNNFDGIADFSSKGPTPFKYLAKPDLVAPGVDINSSFLGGSYKQLSGTSMATPHVAGAVALLLEIHPDWSPEEIKSALMQSSTDLFQNIFSQGTGRMNIYDAASADFAILPGSISIGVLDKQITFSNSYPVSIHNFKSTTQNITITLEGDFNQSGVTATLSTDELSLSGSQALAVQLDLSIDPAVLPISNYPATYVGYIVATNGSKTVRMPISFMNPYVISLDFGNEAPALLIVSSNPGTPYYFRFINPGAGVQKLLLPQGYYDIVSQYYSPISWVFKEHVNASETDQLSLKKENAIHHIKFNLSDVNGQLFPSGLNANLLITGKDSFSSFYFFAPNELYVSDVSDNYIFEYSVNDFIDSEKTKFYNAGSSLYNGVYEDKLANISPRYLPINLNYPHVSSNYGLTNTTNLRGWLTWNTYPIPLNKKFTYFSQKRSTQNTSSFSFLKFSPSQGSTDLTWETGGLAAYENNSLSFKTVPYANEFLSLSADEEFNYNMGSSLIRFDGGIAPIGSNLYLNTTTSNSLFVRSLGEKERGLINYELLSDGNSILKDTISNRLFAEYTTTFPLTDIDPGNYTLRFTYEDYQVQGKFGTAMAEMHFNTSSSDKTAPSIKSLLLLSGELPTNNIVTGQSAIIKLTVADECLNGCDGYNTGIGSTSIKIRKTGEEDWIELNTTFLSSAIQTPLPSSLSEGYYSISLLVTDLGGNSTSFIAEPAFLVGPLNDPIAYVKPILISPLNRDDVAINTSFQWSAIPQATKYVIQISKDEDFENFQESTTALPEYKTSSNLEANTTFYWRVKGSINDNNTPWSKTGKFKTSNQIRGLVSLIQPANQSKNVAFVNTFSWRSDNNSSLVQYRFQLAINDSFTEILVDDTVSTTNYKASVTASKTNYFWRVMALRNDITTSWSSIFQFTTSDREVGHINLITPINKTINQPYNVSFSWQTEEGNIEPAKYRFQLATDSLFTKIIKDETVLSNALNSSVSLPQTVFFWRVISLRTDITPQWSSTFKFTTPNVQITLNSPADKSSEVSLTEMLLWYATPSPQKYVLQISGSEDFKMNTKEITSEKNFTSLNDASEGTIYFWKVRADYSDEVAFWSPVFSFTTKSSVINGLEESDDLILIYPNPAKNSEVFIKTPEKVYGDIFVLDGLGRKVASFPASQNSNDHLIHWDLVNLQGEKVPTGIYFITLKTENKPVSKKLIVLTNN